MHSDRNDASVHNALAGRLQPPILDLKFLLLLEEHSKANDGPVYKQTADNRHHHGGIDDDTAVCEECGESCSRS